MLSIGEDACMEIFAALLAGSFVGAVLGFVGAGGAMLSVPILIYIFDFTPHHATTASLAVVFLAATSGVAAKIRSKEVLYRDALVIWSIGLVTNLGFSSISDKFSEKFITAGFALVLIAAGISSLRPPLSEVHKRMPLSLLIFFALLIGSITGIFGIGGGFLAIPVLVLFFGTPTNVAAGTSLLIIALNSLTAFFGHHAMWGEVEWHIPTAIAITAVIVANLASRAGAFAKPVVMRRAFAVLLFSIAGFTLLQALLHS
jgi:uncharacterized membrane protein YfcA